MLELDFKILGDQQYARAFDTFGTEVADMHEPLGHVADLLRQSTGEQFQTLGWRGGTPWRPLNPDYEKWKAEHYPGRPPLVLTGAMRGALLADGTREHTENRLVWGITDQVDDQGNRIAERAAAHQAGKGHVPARPMVQLTERDRRDMDHEFVAWLNGLNHRTFGR